MRRIRAHRSDDGAVAVTFGLLLVVLLGFIGMGVDVASAYAKSQEVQNGADAGALAVAQQCATSGCAGDQALADEMANANIRQGIDVSTTVSYPASNQVTVVAETDHQNFLLGLFGQDDFRVGEQATAVWGPPSKGTTIMPLTFSQCQFVNQGGASGVPATILFTKTSPAECTLPTSGNTMPAGFAYIGDSAECGSEITVDGWVDSQSGNTPQGCTADELTSLIGEVVLLPIFDACRATNINNAPGCTEYVVPNGNERQYHILGFAAFELHAFNFGGQYKAGSPIPCGGNDRCVRGAFVEWVTLEDAWEYESTAPDLGASVVTLID